MHIVQMEKVQQRRKRLGRNEGGIIMSGSAILMAVVGILIIWGGLAASMINAVVKSRASK